VESERQEEGETMTTRILNLYAGIGGNRKLWGGDIVVTAIELDPAIAKIYQDFFPQDKVIVADAHQYLLEHYKEFDFIWTSPPCPTHSRIRQFSAVARGQNEAVFPDMKLYEEIIFLIHNFDGKWVVENVISYYEPLIKPQELASHYFWSNFQLGNAKVETRGHNAVNEELAEIKGFDLSQYEGIDKKKILRNCVEPATGLHIFNMAYKEKQTTL
jgi:DNA (cytosine-5)-methyltransferase 1